VALLLAAPLAVAQVQVNSTPNLVGSGARALGMGGAFIAIADDATAASWNPGGLTQLERPELSLVYSWHWAGENLNSGLFPEMNEQFDLDWDSINYASIVYPIPWTLAGRNFVVSLNYQRQYDLNRDLKLQYSDYTALRGGGVSDLLLRQDYSQRGRLAALSPAFAMELTDNFSIGVAMNIWDESILPGNEWKERRFVRARGRTNGQLFGSSFSRLEIAEDYENFDGTNWTVGALWQATERLKFGAVYHSKLDASLDYTRRSIVHLSSLNFSRVTTRQSRDMTFPSALGLGAAYRFRGDKLTLSLDVTRREWDQFVITRRWESNSSVLAPFSFGSVSPRRVSGVTNLPTELSPHDPTYTVRLGGEYVFVDETKPKQDYLPSLRAGVFYDPEPASGRKNLWYAPFARYSPILPSTLGLERKGSGEPDDYYGATIGAGVLIKNRVNIDAAYQYRWGSNVRKDTFGFRNTDFDVRQHSFFLSTVVYF
jgi:long-subunit fatty acid transport protein